MRILFAVYKHSFEDQTLLALFELEKDAIECTNYLVSLPHSKYEGFCIQEETQYDDFKDYWTDVRSDKLK